MKQVSKIKIAVSSCLLGNEVRYDGTAKACPEIRQFLPEAFEIIPFCPETAIGMGIPRLPIQLDLIDHSIKARQVNDKSKDYTDSLQNYAKEFLKDNPDVKAVINKKGSPSCGYLSTKLFRNDEIVKNNATGVFIDELTRIREDLPSIDELGFAIESQRNHFLAQIKKP